MKCLENVRMDLAKPRLEIAKFIRGEPVYYADSVNLLIADMINKDNYFEKRVKKMSIDLENATEVANESLIIFNKVLNNVFEKEIEIAESSKRASGNVRKAANELAEGLNKLEKTANFQKLEQYANLLERAASALTILAELEKSGSLGKISLAMK